MNRIFISGRLTRDPELKVTGTGIEVCGFTVAVDRKVDKDGEKKCDFIECTAWRKTGVFVERYFHKGDGINLEGTLQSEKYTDKSGNGRTAWKVVVDNVEFPLNKKSDGSSVGNYEQAAPADEKFAELPENDGNLPF